MFIQSSHAQYDDRPGEAYHFPKRPYLSTVAGSVGDWVVFYEGRRGGARGYYGVQRLLRIEDDPADPGHAYAVMDRGTLLEFPVQVPRLDPAGAPWETDLPLMGGRNTSAVRRLSDGDFARIVAEGLRDDPVPEALPRDPDVGTPGLYDPATAFFHPSDRLRALSNRALRDAAFARLVRQAYRGRCAMSGLALTNGGGRMEVEAAHIVPVAERGPDSVTNGLALSGTLHWMFDRGLLSVDGDGTILTARGSIADEVAQRLIVPDRRLILPPEPAARPHPAYLRWHRDTVFKG